MARRRYETSDRLKLATALFFKLNINIRVLILLHLQRVLQGNRLFTARIAVTAPEIAVPPFLNTHGESAFWAAKFLWASLLVLFAYRLLCLVHPCRVSTTVHTDC